MFKYFIKNLKILLFFIISFSYFPVNGQITTVYKSFDFLDFKPVNNSKELGQRVMLDSVEVVTDSLNKIMKLRLLKGPYSNFEILVSYEQEYILLQFHRIKGSYAEDCRLPQITILPSSYIYCVAGPFCNGWVQDKTINIFKLDRQLMLKNEFIFSHDSDNRFSRLLAMKRISINRNTSFKSLEDEVTFSEKISVPLNYSKSERQSVTYNENLENLNIILECQRNFLMSYDPEKFYDLSTTRYKGKVHQVYYWWEIY